MNFEKTFLGRAGQHSWNRFNLLDEQRSCLPEFRKNTKTGTLLFVGEVGLKIADESQDEAAA